MSAQEYYIASFDNHVMNVVVMLLLHFHTQLCPVWFQLLSLWKKFYDMTIQMKAIGQ